MAALPKIHDNLKQDLPPNKWGKVLTATPVVLTVIATLLAGLSSSELNKAQYDRAFAAQLQSKAGDQWALFQAKRLRGATQSAALDSALLAGADLDPHADTLRAFITTQADPAPMNSALDTLLSGRLPVDSRAKLEEFLNAFQRSRMEQLHSAASTDVAAALTEAEAKSATFDASISHFVRQADAFGEAIEHAPADARGALQRSFAVLRLRYSSMRYDTEAAINQVIAGIREVQVAQSNESAERHRRRSARFFYGMLAAQAGIIIATLAIAAQRRNLLWSIAAVAGLLAASLATYVYLWV